MDGSGRYVAFESLATDLVPGDTNRVSDVFVHDRQTGETTRISVDSRGGQANGGSSAPSLSADGRFVGFGSYGSNLVDGDTNQEIDVFVHDRQTGETTRVSVDSRGRQANGSSGIAALSADGRWVTFHSFASNLVDGDTNKTLDIFVHDRMTGATNRASLTDNGAGNETARAGIPPSAPMPASSPSSPTPPTWCLGTTTGSSMSSSGIGAAPIHSLDSAGHRGPTWRAGSWDGCGEDGTVSSPKPV